MFTTDLSQGSLWRTTDGGVTWTQVVADTPYLGSGPTTGGDQIGVATVAVDLQDTASLWAASAAP